ncbi:MAG: Rab family GTPase [Candidatus Heimdallarchaeota archaeon]
MLISEINIKLVLLGYWGVGKTSIANSFLRKEIPKMYIPTIGSNIMRKEYLLKNNHIMINIWDVGGQKSFNPLNPVFFTNIDIAFLIFDLSNPRDSLLEIQKTSYPNLKKNTPECIIYLIGNKADLLKLENSEMLLNNIRQYNKEEFPIIFTSAKTQNNILEAFELVIYEFLEKLEIDDNNKQFVGISSKFLNLIEKTEEDLRNPIVNLERIDSNILEKKITPKIIKKVIDSDLYNESEVEPNNFQKNTLKIDIMKSNIIDAFNNNLINIESLILDLKKTPIDSLVDKIEKITEDLRHYKEDFELKLDMILDLNKKRKKMEIGNSNK